MNNYSKISPRRFKKIVKNLQSAIDYWHKSYVYESKLSSNLLDNLHQSIGENILLKKLKFWLIVALSFSTICHIINIVLCLVK